MLRKLLLCSALLSPYALSAQEGASQVHFQGIDEPVVEQTLTPEQRLSRCCKTLSSSQTVETMKNIHMFWQLLM